MNTISEMRRTVQDEGSVLVDVEMYNRLQAEWITRAGIEELPPLKSMQLSDAERTVYEHAIGTARVLLQENDPREALEWLNLVVATLDKIDEEKQKGKPAA